MILQDFVGGNHYVYAYVISPRGDHYNHQAQITVLAHTGSLCFCSVAGRQEVPPSATEALPAARRPSFFRLLGLQDLEAQDTACLLISCTDQPNVIRRAVLHLVDKYSYRSDSTRTSTGLLEGRPHTFEEPGEL